MLMAVSELDSPTVNLKFSERPPIENLFEAACGVGDQEVSVGFSPSVPKTNSG